MVYVYPLTIDPLGLSRSDSIDDKKAFSKSARMYPSNECHLKLTVSQLRLLAISCSFYIKSLEDVLGSSRYVPFKWFFEKSISDLSSIRDNLESLLKDVSQ